MNRSVYLRHCSSVCLSGAVILSLLGSLPLHAVDPNKGPGQPFDPDVPPMAKEVQRLADNKMGQVTSIAVSKDGKHAYAAAFGAGTLSILDRDPDSGMLTFREALTADHYNGLVAFRLSPDETLGAGSAFGSDALILFGRDPATGAIKELDHFGAQNPIPELDFCIDNVFSPDGKFVYTVGSHAIVAFKVSDGKLIHMESYSEPDPGAAGRVMRNARGVAVSPNGKWLYSSWQGSATVLVHSRDQETGKLKQLQTVTDGVDGVNGLAGVMHCTVSADGNYLYTASGRFGGGDSVCCFQIKAEGELAMVQSLTADELPEGFGGGNEIQVSPDGLMVAVACTTADRLARFSRDPVNGRLTAIDCLPCGAEARPGACGLVFDARGRFLLVADENSNSIVTFRFLRL